METERFQITYAAHTGTCTFLLDADGICRRIVVLPSKGKRRESSRSAARCVGAQYVASLDSGAAGGLVEMPRVGAAMLFARVDERGRVSLVRTGAVTSFESQAAEDPFAESCGVQTSAPEIDPARAYEGDVAPTDPDYGAASDRTQRIQALRPDDLAAALGMDAATAEYRAAEAPAAHESHAHARDEDDEHEELAPRTTMPSRAAPSHAPTLRRPHRDATIEADGEYAAPPPARAFPSRGMLPRRSDPYVRAANGAAVARTAPPVRPSDPMHTPRAYSRPAASDVQIASRRRRGT